MYCMYTHLYISIAYITETVCSVGNTVLFSIYIYSVQCPEKEHASLSVEANLDHTLLIRHTRLKAIFLHQPSIEKYQEQDKGETANVSPSKV